MRHSLWLILFLLASGLAPGARAQSGRQKSAATPPAAAATPAAEPEGDSAWREFFSTMGGFSVLMPGEPWRDMVPLETGLGVLRTQVFKVETAVAVYILMYTDFPEELVTDDDPRGSLDAAVKKLKEDNKGKLLFEADIALDNFPGRRLKIEEADTFFWARVYAVGRRFYQVFVVTRKAPAASPKLAELYETTALRFLDSFKLRQ